MKCPRCQHQNEAAAKFCEECAAPLARTCSNCGRQLSPAAKFCPECAHPAGAPAGQPRFTSPEAYTPKHLAEKILTSRSALEGERKQVTVFFADLKGSMELLADRDPEEARKILDPVLELMMEAVHRYEGTVNQVMGDGIMALFGAPVAHEDHAGRACYAALRMQEAAGRYAEELRRTQGLDVLIRVGLNSGEVVVRAIGSDLRMDYTAVGQTTHLAARMEQLARPGTTLLTRETLRLAEGWVEVKSLGSVPVRGLAEPVEVYELLRASAVRSRLQAVAARGLTRFVGRDAELAALCGALDRARAGHGQVVALVGEPGVGKSRLVWELTHSHRTQGWLVLESGSASYGKATPYLPFIDLLKAYFQIEARDDARKIQEKVTGRLLSLDRGLEPALSAFLSLLGGASDDASWQALDPNQRRQRTLDGLRRLVLRESQAQPLVLVFEDLHWVDGETQRLLDRLVESLPTARILLLVNYRPEYQHGWSGKSYYAQLRLDPLPRESAAALLETILGSDAGLGPLKRLLIERTEGNPFFLEECVRTLAEGGTLAGARGAYQLTASLSTVQVPPTVQAVLAARMDRLAPEEKRLLQTAAVVGEHVPWTLLHAVAAMPDEELHRALARLQALEFLYETGLFPDLEYTFKHGLTYQVAYSSLLADRRRSLHAGIMAAIEHLYADHLAGQVERLALHAFRGEVWDKALTYLRQAGKTAASRSANREAVGYFEQALAALEHLPRTGPNLEQQIDLRFDLRNAHFSLGEHERILEHLRAAEPLAEALGDRRRLGRLLGYLSIYFHFVDPRRAIDPAERALEIARGLGDVAFHTEMNQRVALVHETSGDFDRAIALSRETLMLLTGDLVHQCWMGPSLTAVLCRWTLGWCLSQRGEFSEAVGLAEEAVAIAESVTSSDSLVLACTAAGRVHLRRGDLARAISHLQRAVGVAESAGIGVFLPQAASALGSAYVLSGRVAEGLERLEQGATDKTSARRVDLAVRLGEGYLLAGRPERATVVGQEALVWARADGARPDEASALRLLGDVMSREGDASTAEAMFRQALTIAEALGMRPLVAHCHLGLGRLDRRVGKRDQAHEHLTTAIGMYREMDMRFWLEQAEGELRESR